MLLLNYSIILNKMKTNENSAGRPATESIEQETRDIDASTDTESAIHYGTTAIGIF